MIFIDKIKIKLFSGKGGNGKIYFIKKRKNKKKYYGGQGGDGGNIYLKIDSNINNLNYFYKNNLFYSQNGFNGKSKFKKGKNGNNLILKIPFGTLIKNLNNNKIILNSFFLKKKFFLIKGGKGNIKFNKNKKKNNIFGFKGKKIDLLLDFNIFSHIILIGFPNSGKSTFLNSISNTKNKINNYLFTTLKPIKCVLNLNFKKKIFLLDLPGLIKNSYSGLGLGLRFLKHIFLNKIIFHFIDINYYKNIYFLIKNINIINNELYKYNKYYFYKPIVFFFNKLDLYFNNFFFYKKFFIFNNFFFYYFFLSSKKKYLYKKFFFIIYNNLYF